MSAPKIEFNEEYSILKYTWPDSEQLNAELKDLILLKETQQSSACFSNKGGWHSGKVVQQWDEPCVKILLSRISVVYEDITERLGIDKDLNFIAWSIVSRQGHGNYPHKHGTTVCGVYYVDAGGHPNEEHPNSGVTPFFKDRDKIPIEGIDNIEKHVVVPQEGVLLMFPGDLLHLVTSYEGDQERIIVGYDFYVDAYPIETYERFPLEHYME